MVHRGRRDGSDPSEAYFRDLSSDEQRRLVSSAEQRLKDRDSPISLTRLKDSKLSAILSATIVVLGALLVVGRSVSTGAGRNGPPGPIVGAQAGYPPIWTLVAVLAIVAITLKVASIYFEKRSMRLRWEIVSATRKSMMRKHQEPRRGPDEGPFTVVEDE